MWYTYHPSQNHITLRVASPRCSYPHMATPRYHADCICQFRWGPSWYGYFSVRGWLKVRPVLARGASFAVKRPVVCAANQLLLLFQGTVTVCALRQSHFSGSVSLLNATTLYRIQTFRKRSIIRCLSYRTVSA